MSVERPRQPPSPCLGICRLHPEDDHCVGCLRTIGEISGWPRMSIPEKLALIESLAGRRRAREAAEREGG
ncbi:MAG: DUF1289 domain-containing protein [Ectothiorhodospiraceae bacterium]|nr:DUF1289 domain-containing protein [Chromatiales bacterium]MCP5154673.1 DUF1289 domain-containing protein [Ectothiorhodospiraceae bacterium]